APDSSRAAAQSNCRNQNAAGSTSLCSHDTRRAPQNDSRRSARSRQWADIQGPPPVRRPEAVWLAIVVSARHARRASSCASPAPRSACASSPAGRLLRRSSPAGRRCFAGLSEFGHVLELESEALRTLEARGHIFPIPHVPDGVEELRLFVLVLQVIRVLPRV